MLETSIPENNTIAQATAITLPCLVAGRLEAVEDVDYFKFEAKEGERLTFEVFCARIQDKIHDLQKHAKPMLVLYDAEAGETEAARELAEAILDACLDAGGSLTGEHGVGMDKACSMPRMFSDRDLQTFERLRRAFDPEGICNPGKVIPTPRLCGEIPGPYRPHALERIGVAERL